MALSTAIDCPSLEDTGLVLSTTNTSTGTSVTIGCSDLGHRPSGDIEALICLSSGNWSSPVPQCEWSWEFNTQEKIIFGTSVAAVSFIIVVVIAIIVAYMRCVRKRGSGREEKLYESSYHGSSPRVGHTGMNGPYNENGTYPDTYLAYQDMSNDSKFEAYPGGGSLDKPWLGYIPRPKVSEDKFYN